MSNLTQSPFVAVFSNTFINGRREISNNLSTSKSKVAAQVLAERDYNRRKEEFLRESSKLRKKIVHCRNLVLSSRKEGMKMLGEERVEKFKYAAAVERMVKELAAEISKLAKKYKIS